MKIIVSPKCVKETIRGLLQEIDRESAGKSRRRLKDRRRNWPPGAGVFVGNIKIVQRLIELAPAANDPVERE